MLIFTFICLLIPCPVNHPDLASSSLASVPCPNIAPKPSNHRFRIMSDPITEADILAIMDKFNEKIDVFENDSKTLQKELIESTMQSVSQKLCWRDRLYWKRKQPLGWNL